MRIAPSLAFLSILLCSAPLAAQGIEPFLGRFEGKSMAATGDDRSARDLTVVITKTEDGKGFTVEWKTVIHRADGGDDQRHERVRFIPTKRPNIFSAGSRGDMFGKLVPIDPISGDAYYWARIRGNTLSVFNIIVTEHGGYEMQVYHRTLKDGGDMTVEFKRIRDGEQLRTITSEVKRTK